MAHGYYFTCSNSYPKKPLNSIIEQAHPFSQDWVTITKEEYINLTHQENYWHTHVKQNNTKLEDENQYLKAKIKDLQNRVFGKNSEKKGLAKSEKNNTTSSKKRGQRLGSKGHGRTPHPALPVILKTPIRLRLKGTLPFVLGKVAIHCDT